MTSHCRSAASPSWPRALPQPLLTWSWTISRPATRSSGTRRRNMSTKTLTIALMDPPYECENLTTAFRILDVAARRGYHVNVFAYEGASALAFVRQTPHPNPVHGKNVAEENHPNYQGPGGRAVGRGRAQRRQRRELRGRWARRSGPHRRPMEADAGAADGPGRGRSGGESQDSRLPDRGGPRRAWNRYWRSRARRDAHSRARASQAGRRTRGR